VSVIVQVLLGLVLGGIVLRKAFAIGRSAGKWFMDNDDAQFVAAQVFLIIAAILTCVVVVAVISDVVVDIRLDSHDKEIRSYVDKRDVDYYELEQTRARNSAWLNELRDSKIHSLEKRVSKLDKPVWELRSTNIYEVLPHTATNTTDCITVTNITWTFN